MSGRDFGRDELLRQLREERRGRRETERRAQEDRRGREEAEQSLLKTALVEYIRLCHDH